MSTDTMDSVVDADLVRARQTLVTSPKTGEDMMTILSRQLHMVALLCVAMRVLAGVSHAAQTTPEHNHPNIVFLMTDDQRWDAMGCMGNRVIQTPQMDRLASDGVLFTNCFVTTSICCVSRASVLTGQHARRHGVSGLGEDNNCFRKTLSAESMAQTYPALLRKVGYSTGFVGKWGIGHRKPLPVDQFDYWRGFDGQGSYFDTKGDTTKEHLTARMGKQAAEFITQSAKANKPFCLSVSFKAPHAWRSSGRVWTEWDRKYADLYEGKPMPVGKTATPEMYEKLHPILKRSFGGPDGKKWVNDREELDFQLRGYYRLITGVDAALGTIRNALKDLGIAENTIIIFTSDNGHLFGDHGLHGKWVMYEESIRVPLIIYDPRLPKSLQSSRRAEMVLNIDMAPTILEMAGLPIPNDVQGRSLTAVLRKTAKSWRSEFFYEHAFRADGNLAHVEGIRTHRWKYTRYVNTDPVFEELFDLKQDPHEENNLAHDPAYKPQRDKLRGMLIDRKKGAQ